jgi:hypothetical protein
MKLRYQNITLVSFLISISFLIQACSASGSLTSNAGVKEYSVDFNQMKKVVERAIKSSNLNISRVFETDSNNRMTLIVNRERLAGSSQSVQQERGEVRIIKVDENNTRIEIDNPDYHFSVPRHQRKDYQQIIYSRIDRQLKE